MAEGVGVDAGESGVFAPPGEELGDARVAQRTLAAEPQGVGLGRGRVARASAEVAGEGLAGRRRDGHHSHAGLAAQGQEVPSPVPVADGETGQLAAPAAGVEQDADYGVVAPIGEVATLASLEQGADARRAG